MQEGAQALGGLGGEGRVRLVGQRGAVLQGAQSPFVEGMQGIEHRLVVAAQFVGDVGRAFAAGAGQEHLAAAHDKGIGGAQAALQRLPLVVRQRTDKNGSFHIE